MGKTEKFQDEEVFITSPQNTKNQDIFDSLAYGRNTVLALPRHIAVEYFDSGALLLDLRKRTLAEVDSDHTWVLTHLDGQRTIGELIKDYAETFHLTNEEATKKVQETCEKLLREQCLRLIQGSWGEDTMDATRYVQNPDVNLREEDEDGALLFNPDTNGVQLLNNTGFYIWKLCAEGRTMSEIAATFKKDFDEVPDDQVTADVEEFLNGMVENGFIGMLEAP